MEESTSARCYWQEMNFNALKTLTVKGV